MILSFNLGGVHQLQKLYQFLYYKRLTCIQIPTARQQRRRRKSKYTNHLRTTSSLMSTADDYEIQGNQNILKKFFVIEVCLLLSANLNTVHFEQMFVKTLISLVISNNLAFQQVSSPGAGASVVTASDSDFPPNVACFHRLPGKH